MVALAATTAIVVRRMHDHKVRRAVQELGLTVEYRLIQPMRITGKVHGVEVMIEQVANHSRIRIPNLRIPESLQLSAEGLLTRTLSRDVPTGDAQFDRSVFVQGDPATILALLDHKTRKMALSEIRAGASIGKQAIERQTAQLSQALELLPRLAELAARLAISTPEIPEKLFEQATSDPNQVFRLSCLRALHSKYSSTRPCIEASTACLRAIEPELRLAAADFFAHRLRLPKETEGRSAEVLAKIAIRSRYRNEFRATAILALSQPRWRTEAIPVLEAVLAEPQIPEGVHKVAIEGIARLRFKEAIPDLERTEPRAQGVAAEAIAEALGRIGDPAGQPCLLRLLARDDRSIRLKTIESLAKIGDAAAVEPLLALTGNLLPDAVSEAAASAVARIQARIGGGEPGQLSLVEPAGLAGALSPSDETHRDGALSLAPDTVLDEGSSADG